MKTRGLFLSALMMSAIFAGCSSDESINEVPQERKVIQKESYVSINIVAADATGSRAATEGGFASGSDEENRVNDLVLVFFDANGNHYEAQSPDFTWETVDESNPAVEKKSNVVVVFDEQEVKPASFVALLNTGKAASEFDNMSLAQVKAQISNYYTTAEGTNNFVMSNSVYSSDKGIQVAAPITDDMICSTEDAAKANPAIAYVERVAAKLQASASTDITVNGKEVTLDGKTTTLTPEITGMTFTHKAPDSYLLKNIDGFDTNAPFANWNDAANFRSYWANSYNTSTSPYSTASYNDAITAGVTPTEYANENTSATTTKLLVTATIKAETDGTPVDIFKYKGYYYTESGLNTYIASILKGKSLKYTKDNAEGDDWASVLTVSHPDNAEQWEGVIGVAEGVNVTDETKAEIDKLDKVLWWNEGKCYFYVPVEHFGDKTGVVRNHAYNLSISSITGLGTPVADPTEPIDPGKIEEETYYVAAQIKVLKWKLVTQNVMLK